MAYTKYTWRTGSGGGTPITADRLNAIETGLHEAHASVSVAERLADEYGTTQTDVLVGNPDVSGNGTTPTKSGSVITSRCSGSNGSYRSELIWSTDTTTSSQIRMGRGWHLAAEWDMILDSGFSSQDPGSWNVLAQVHGPALNGTWYPPPVELNFQGGSYRVSNSGDVPLADGSTTSAFDEYMPRLWVPNPVGTWHHWKLAVRLGGPGVGQVDLWCDWKHVVKGWRPAAGTFYTQPPASSASTAQHNYVVFKTGLYGSQSSGIAKTVQHKDLRITTQDVNNIKTWRL